VELSVGVLIIGSLYWDTRGGRDAWREKRLQMEGDFIVTAPIRYGRRSLTGTYTMVFGDVPKLGQARVVPCKRSAKTVDDLIEEAEWLWSAERREVPPDESELDHALSSTWGCVALLTSPTTHIRESWLQCWAHRVLTKNAGGRIQQHLVDDRGLLEVPWPEFAQGEGPVLPDLLLATTNSPSLTNNAFPTADEIADAWNREIGDSAEYFRRNRSSGIYTFEDESILSRLRPELR
jgi:hypothetical protein